MLKACGKLVEICGKDVQKSVEKSVESACKKSVENHVFNKDQKFFTRFFQKSTKSGRVLPTKMHKFYTAENINYYLLSRSFPRFPHTSTITTTISIRKKKYI